MKSLLNRLKRSAKLTIDDKRKLLETRIADGEILRGKLKKQIGMSIILRHEYASGYKTTVEDWFIASAGSLEDIFDTKMVASKFRNVYPFSIGDFDSPRVKIVDPRTDQEKLEDLDRQVKKGIRNLERILEDFKIQNPNQEHLLIKFMNGSFFMLVIGLVLWVIYKLTGTDLRGWLK